MSGRKRLHKRRLADEEEEEDFNDDAQSNGGENYDYNAILAQIEALQE